MLISSVPFLLLTFHSHFTLSRTGSYHVVKRSSWHHQWPPSCQIQWLLFILTRHDLLAACKAVVQCRTPASSSCLVGSRCSVNTLLLLKGVNLPGQVSSLSTAWLTLRNLLQVSKLQLSYTEMWGNTVIRLPGLLCGLQCLANCWDSNGHSAEVHRSQKCTEALVFLNVTVKEK